MILLGLFMILVHRATTTCDVCVPEKCKPVNLCQTQLVYDECNCCLICAPNNMKYRCSKPEDCGKNTICIDDRSGKPVQALKYKTSGRCVHVDPLPDDSLKGFEKCLDVNCPKFNRHPCSPDSIRPRSRLNNCCIIPKECECIAKDQCPFTASCPDGHIMRVEPATRRPGRCCPSYVCVPDHWKACNDGEKTREDGTTWRKPRSCEICKCHSGKILCEAEKCPRTDHCKWTYNKPESCCSICAGCILDGKYWKNFQTWMRGSCEKCACNDGIIECKKFQCPPVDCLNPIRQSDRCCPTCPQSSIKPEEIPCPLHCPNGFDKDSLGRDLCACAPLFLCNPISHCSLSCEFGYKKDEFNCEICECRKCKLLTSRCQNLDCPYGLTRDLLGCEMCACLSYLQTDRTSNHNLITVTSAASTCTGNDLYLEDGQIFVDGCKKCLCETGRLLCTVLTCPAAKCADPVVKADKCCPQCPDKPLLNTNKTATCATLRKKNDSTTWNLDECTICTCRDGFAWCHVKECPPLTCTHPIRKEGECCLQCSNSQPSVRRPNINGHNCGEYRKDGDSWRENACTSCSCVDGRISCYVHICPELHCEEALLLEGRCCPFCASYRIAPHPTPFSIVPTTFVEIQTTVDRTSSVTQKMSSSITKKIRDSSVDTDLIPKTTNPESLKSSWITWLLLGVVIVLTIAVIALVFALIWNCHHHNPASSIPASSASIGQRPKSTNLDLQGQCPLIPTHRYSLVAQVAPPVSQRKCNELVDVVVKSDEEPTEEL